MQQCLGQGHRGENESNIAVMFYKLRTQGHLEEAMCTKDFDPDLVLSILNFLIILTDSHQGVQYGSV